jgi:hypothetical protein
MRGNNMVNIARIITLALLLVSIFVITGTANAATTADVVVTASGYVVGSPSGLVISYSGEDYVDISWTKGLLAVNTMVRVGHTGYPNSLTDGGLVYYGNGTSTQYVYSYATLLANEEYEGLYFTAWSQNAAGVWQTIGSTTGAYSFWQDVNMLFVIVAMILLTLVFFAFRLKNIALSIVSAFGWSGLAIQQLNLYYTYASITGMEPLIGYTCVVLSIAMFFAPLMFIAKPKVIATPHNVGILDDVFNDSDIKGMMRARKEIYKYRKRR